MSIRNRRGEDKSVSSSKCSFCFRMKLKAKRTFKKNSYLLGQAAAWPSSKPSKPNRLTWLTSAYYPGDNPDMERGSLEARIWWDNQMVQSITYPLGEFSSVQF